VDFIESLEISKMKCAMTVCDIAVTQVQAAIHH
jgi:hypothetical protein